MNNYKITIVICLFSVLYVNTFGQPNTPAFEVTKSGQGSKSIIFIPGFASSGDVWNETKAMFEKDFTCYTLTMAGFAGVKPQVNATCKSWEISIATYIEDNKIEKPMIIGHSMGGVLAMALASDYPQLIAFTFNLGHGGGADVAVAGARHLVLLRQVRPQLEPAHIALVSPGHFLVNYP